MEATASHAGGSVTVEREVVVRDVSGLHVGLVAEQGSVQPGEALGYTLIVTNTDDTNAQPAGGDGVVTASLPAGTSFVSASGGGQLVGDEVQWSVGSVAPGGSQRYSYMVAVDNGLVDATILTAQARVRDSEAGLASALATVEVQSSSPLSLSMTAGPDPVARGGMITYQLEVSNVSDTALTDVLLEARMPDINGTAFNRGSWVTGGGGCVTGNNICSPGQYISWPVFTLSAGETQAVSFDVRVNSSDASVVPDGTVARVEATASHDGGSVTVEREVVVDQ